MVPAILFQPGGHYQLLEDKPAGVREAAVLDGQARAAGVRLERVPEFGRPSLPVVVRSIAERIWLPSLRSGGRRPTASAAPSIPRPWQLQLMAPVTPERQFNRPTPLSDETLAVLRGP